jgi:hypothetical protein
MFALRWSGLWEVGTEVLHAVIEMNVILSVSCLRRSVVECSPRRCGFELVANPCEVYLRVCRFSFVCNIPPMLHTHLDLTNTSIRRLSRRYLGTLKQRSRLSGIGYHRTGKCFFFLILLTSFFKGLNQM